MLLTGRSIDAETAESWGMITRLATWGTELDAAFEIAGQTARTAPTTRRALKREIGGRCEVMDLMSTNESIFGPEPIEGFNVFREHRNPSWVAEDLRTEGRLRSDFVGWTPAETRDDQCASVARTALRTRSFWIFPMGLRSMASITTICSGHLYRASPIDVQ
jgi:hypothetical protein